MPGGNSAYSPLPQSNSDSDGSSDEELRLSQENRVVNRTAKTQNSKTENSYNGQKHNVINYKPLDSDGDVGVTLIKFQPSADEAPILKASSSSEVFSTSRKICFVISLLLCIFTTVVFIWILPCNIEICPNASYNKNNNYTWEKTFSGLEIYGPISLVPDKLGRNESLLFMTRNPLGSSGRSLSENVLICLHGKNGSLSWNTTLNKEPTEIDCKLTDVNADGFKDCLIYGRNFLKALNPITGKELWDVSDSNNQMQQLQVLDFPLVISDINADKIKDLLVLCSVADSSGVSFQNYLVIVSGRSGAVVEKPLQIKFCSAVYNLMYENSSVVSYTCYNSSKKESLQTVNLTNLYNTMRNVSMEKWNQHTKFSNILYSNGLRLTIDNQGSCPEDCIVVIEIKDERGGLKNKTSYSFKNKNAFGMAPVAVKSEEGFGFAMKMWKWHSKKQNFEEFFSRNISSQRRGKRNRLIDSSSLDREMLSEGSQEFNRWKRTAYFSGNAQIEGKKTNVGHLNLRLINETIIKVIFLVNDSRVQEKKIREDDLIQVCREPLPCQPDARQQKNSMLISDLNHDGREELIVFNSKYVHEGEKTNDNNEAWRLRSRIQVINL